MQNTYQITRMIHATHTNAQTRLDPYGAMRLFQDITSEHSRELGVDYYTMLHEANAFWVITKMKMHFERAPRIFETAEITTWPLAAQRVSCERCYTLTTSESSSVTARSEWVVLDADTRAIRRPETTPYPIDFDYRTDKILPEPFARLRAKPEGAEPYMMHTVLSGDIDMSRHTNNTMYARFMTDCFSCAFFDEYEVEDVEINFQHESREGETIAIYKLVSGENAYTICGVNEAQKPVFTAWMKLRPVNE